MLYHTGSYAAIAAAVGSVNLDDSSSVLPTENESSSNPLLAEPKRGKNN